MVKQDVLLFIVIFHLIHTGTGEELTTVSVKAGENASLPCPGLTSGASSAPGGFQVNQLVWSRCAGKKTCLIAGQSGQLVTFSGGKVRVHEQPTRLSLDVVTWALHITESRAEDTGVYSCVFNKQASDGNIARLLVTDVASPPGRPMVLRHESRLVRLSWAPSKHANNAPVQYYVLQTRYGNSGLWPSVEAGQRTVSNNTNITVSGLTPFTVYTFRVVAVNAMGVSQPSAASYPVQTQRERPGAAPKLVFARNRSSTSIEVGWEPPANYTLHGEFTGYRLTYRPLEPSRLPGSLTEVELHDISLRTYVIDGLEPFTKYEITLQVKNPEHLSPPDTISAITSEGVPSRPEAVTFLEVVDRTLRLGWTPPRRPNGHLLGYTVYWSEQGATTRSHEGPDGEAVSYILDTLEPDKEYTVWLKARTVAGEGDRSFPVTTRTDVSGPGAPVITNISCPSDTSLVLHWRRPRLIYRSVDMYYLLYRTNENWDFVERHIPLMADGLNFSVILPNLTTNELYELRVQGATFSVLVPKKVYKGQQSASAKVRMERHCQHIQLYSTWQHRPSTALAGSQLTGILVGCLLVTVTIISAVLWRRRRLKRYPIDSDVKPSGRRGRAAGWPALSHEAIPARLFGQHLRQLHADGGAGLLRDWQSLRAVALPAGEDGSGIGQVDGRETLVQPVQPRRRRGRGAAVPTAYHVDGYRRARAYTVTERPAGAGTALEGFWRLVWEQRTSTAVVIGGRQATVTSRLAPEAGQTQTSGDLELRCISDRLLTGCVVTEVIVAKRKKERRVHLYEYTDCTESGLPDGPLTLLQLVRRTTENPTTSTTTSSSSASAAAAAAAAPVLVVTGQDCRGAGLYLGLATLLTQLNCSHELAVLSYCQHIVAQCPGLLGTLDEYSLLHECLLERVSVGDTLVPRDAARVYVENLQGGSRDSFPHPTAEKQYKSVIALGAGHFTVVSAARPCNEAKNRSLSFIPMEPSRVMLPADPALEGACYINASWLPGYRDMQEYILTQHPMPSTVLDFWQMIWRYRITTVACLSPEGCGIFWPSEEEAIRGPNFVVRYMSESADCSVTYKTSWVIRSFLLQSVMGGTSDVTTRVVYLPLWPEECPLDAVLEGVVGVRAIQGERPTPMVVVDRYGGTEGASFCLLTTVIRQLEQETSFDIFTYAKLYHQRRPGIWKNMREYLYLYHAVEAWLASRGHGTLRRGGSCTSLCENRTPVEVSLNGRHGVMV